MWWQSSQGTTEGVRPSKHVTPIHHLHMHLLVYCRRGRGPWHVKAQAPNLPSLTTRSSRRIWSEIPMYYTPTYEVMIELSHVQVLEHTKMMMEISEPTNV
jgi:hypothetical protein